MWRMNAMLSKLRPKLTMMSCVSLNVSQDLDAFINMGVCRGATNCFVAIEEVAQL